MRSLPCTGLMVLLGLPGCLAHLGDGVPSPTVSFVAPEAGVFDSGSLELEIAVTDFTIDGENMGGPRVPTFGHWELVVDGSRRGFVGELTYPLGRLATGTHVLTAVLRENDYTLLDPDVRSSVDIEVSETARRVVISHPFTTQDVPILVQAGNLLDLVIAPYNFGLDEASIGGPADPCNCAGHWHAFVDGVDVLESASVEEYLDLENLPGLGTLEPGVHSLEVRLTHHDHSDLDPPSFDLIYINLQ